MLLESVILRPVGLEFSMLVSWRDPKLMKIGGSVDLEEYDNVSFD